MQLKMWVLSGAALVLWLAPLTALDKRIGWHKFIQGFSLCGAVVCAVTGGNIARKLSDEAEIEALKVRAIKADVEDEIATEVYVSQKQRQQEAEQILTSPGVDVEASRKALEAIYSNDLQESASASETSEYSEYPFYLEVRKALDEGKTKTWIIENVLKMKGRKFGEGKVWLQDLLDEFDEK